MHAPANGERVDASPGSSAFRLVLADALLARLAWRDMGAAKLAWADGVVAPAAPGDVPELLPPADDGAGATQGGVFIGAPLLRPAPARRPRLASRLRDEQRAAGLGKDHLRPLQSVPLRLSCRRRPLAPRRAVH